MKTRKTISYFDFSIQLLNNEFKSLTETFTCGETYPEAGLADYLKNQAFEDMETGNGVTYLVIDNSSNIIAGYCTLISSSLPYYYRTEDEEEGIYQTLCEIPAIKIFMFAVDERYQDTFYENKPISAWILEAIIAKINSMSSQVAGIKAIYLHALPSAEEFYLKNNFSICEEYFQPFSSDDDDLKVMYALIREVHIVYEKSK